MARRQHEDRGKSRRYAAIALVTFVLAVFIAVSIVVSLRPVADDRSSPDSAETLDGSADDWLAQGLELAHRLADDFPENVAALDLAARYEQRFGDREKATALWQRCLNENPRSAYALFCLGSAAWERGDFEQAIEPLQQALALDPRLGNAAVVLGESLMQLGRIEETVAVLEKAQHPQPPAMHRFLLAQAYLQLQRYDKSRENFEQALAFEPEFTRAHYGLVTVWTRLGNTEKAAMHKAAFLRLKAVEDAGIAATRYDPRDAGANEVRQTTAQLFAEAARLYDARGDRARAAQLVERAAALRP